MTQPFPDENQYTLPLAHLREQTKHAPHVIFIRETERLDEAMALGRDPYPAFCAWQSALAIWASEDKLFQQQARKLDELLAETYRTYGSIPRLEYVRAWRPLYFGVMRRMGLFEAVDKHVKTTRHDDVSRLAGEN